MSTASIAPGKISLAIDRLNSEYPLHAGILSQWKVEESAEISTMGVGFRNNRLCLIYSAAFVEETGMDELMGVLHHEVNHVLFGHVYQEPEEQEDGQARTIAEEVTVNEWVPEPLPGTPVLLEQYPFLPENESTDDRYKRLRKKQKNDSKRTRGAPFRGVPSCSKQKSPNSTGAGPQRPKGKGQPGQGTQQGGQEGSSAQRSGTQPGGKAKAQQAHQPASNGVPTTDDHSMWAEARKRKEQAERSAKTDIAVAWGSLTLQEREKVTEPFAEIAEAAAEESGFEAEPCFGVGDKAGEEIDALYGGKGHIPWQVVLRRHVGRILERRPVFGRPPRRFPDMAGIIPGKGRFAQKPKVMAAIDTSGSMSGPMLAEISAELGLMAKHYDVVVAECDTRIYQVYPYRPIESVMGRGGTDLRPPLEPDFLKKHQPDVVVYFTDGYGPAPDKPPTVPVVWCLTEDGQEPVPWGMKIALSEPKIGPDVPNFGTGPDILGNRPRESGQPVRMILTNKHINGET